MPLQQHQSWAGLLTAPLRGDVAVLTRIVRQAEPLSVGWNDPLADVVFPEDIGAVKRNPAQRAASAMTNYTGPKRSSSAISGAPNSGPLVASTRPESFQSSESGSEVITRCSGRMCLLVWPNEPEFRCAGQTREQDRSH